MDSESIRKPPEILPVKSLPDTDDRPLHPNLPKPPALLLMISPIRTGKSTIISNLLLNSNFFGQDYFDETIVFSPTIQMIDPFTLTYRSLQHSYL